MATLTCAACGEKQELCNSPRSEGVRQPRLCKKCLIASMRTNDDLVKQEYWLRQLIEAKDTESINHLIGKA